MLAFTLVELLVVIGIIAVLISILLPTLNSARQQAYSAQCLSNLKQVGQAALIYAAENKGWFAPGHGGAMNSTPATVQLSRTDASFVDYGNIAADGTKPNPLRWAVAEAMARCAGYKPVVPWREITGVQATDVAAERAAGGGPMKTPCFYCPTFNQPVSGSGTEPFPENNLLNHDPSLVGNNGNACTKMTYLWVANPFHAMDPGTLSAIAAARVSEDFMAANVTLPGGSGNAGFCHMDKDPDQSTVVDFDPTRPCRPGYDYLRRTSDKRASEVAIAVDNSRQIQSGFSYYPHGSMNGHYQKTLPNATNGASGMALTIAPRAWFNELFGDGHCESRRGDQLRMRWASSNPQAW